MITTPKGGKQRVRIYTDCVEVAFKVADGHEAAQAGEWEVTQKVSLRDQSFVKPVNGRTKFSVVVELFVSAQEGVMNPQSLDAIRFATGAHFLEGLARLPIGRINPPMIVQWYDEVLEAAQTPPPRR